MLLEEFDVFMSLLGKFPGWFNDQGHWDMLLFSGGRLGSGLN